MLVDAQGKPLSSGSTDPNNPDNLQVTESDGEWISETIQDIMPGILGEEWLEEGVQDTKGGAALNRFRQRGTNLVVMVSIRPIRLAADPSAKKVAYTVTVARDEDGKIRKPNTADINRARSTFFSRDLTETERQYEGTIGDSKAHHIMAVIDWSPIVVKGA
tara:strand:+ start:291998 stop:292480 length:483 start_codon:yes stop_codon:yes gene_type:complete